MDRYEHCLIGAQYNIRTRNIEILIKPANCPETMEVIPHYISREAASELMDDLIRAGIRPTNGMGEPAHVKALESHITDLRTIAFKVLKVEK